MATGTSHAAALSSGTAALGTWHCCITALGPADRVIVPTMTFAATVNAVCYTGANPVFVDVDPATANLDPVALAGLSWLEHLGLDRAPKALVTVDLYGQCCDYDACWFRCARNTGSS